MDRKGKLLTKTDKTYTIPFGGFRAVTGMYDIDVTGYENQYQ